MFLSEDYIDTNLNRYVRAILLIAVSYACIFWIQFHFGLFRPISYLIFALMAVWIVLASRKAFLGFIVIAVLSDTHYLYGYELFASIYTVKIGPLSLIDILVILFAAMAIFQALLQGISSLRLNTYDRCCVGILSIVFLASIFGLAFAPTMRNWLVDVKIMIFFLIPYGVIRFWFKNPTDLRELFEYFFWALVGKLCVYTFAYFLKFGNVGAGFIRVSLTSDLALYSIPLVFGLCFFLTSTTRKSKAFVTVIVFLSFFAILFGFGREIWAWTVLVLGLLFFLLSNTEKAIVAGRFVGIVGLAVIVAFVFYASLFKYMEYNVKTFSMKTTPKKGEISGSVRTIEWVNIIAELNHSMSLLQGKGMGATWTDDYMSLPKKRDAFSFPVDEYDHVFAHMSFSQFLLKFGLIGSILFWGVLGWGWLTGLHRSKRLIGVDRFFALTLTLGLVAPLAKLNMVRIALMAGILFGILSTFWLVLEIHFKNQQNILVHTT